MANLFNRLAKRQPPAAEPAEPDIVRQGPRPLVPPAHAKSSPSEKLLSWVLNYWPAPIVSLRDIRAFGPWCIRDPRSVTLHTIRTLAEYGWLIEIPTHRRDRRVWKVVREPRLSSYGQQYTLERPQQRITEHQPSPIQAGDRVSTKPELVTHMTNGGSTPRGQQAR